jgi:hypothetical protein
LLGALVDVPDDGMVAFSSNYGDRAGTEQVHALNGDVKEEAIYETVYSRSGYAVSHLNNDADELGAVWIIS